MIIVPDVETSGLVVPDMPLSDPSQPRIVQLAFVVQDADRRTMFTYSSLIKPDGWEITPQAARVHKITTEQCARYGVDGKVALLAFVSALKTVRTVVAHNLGFEAALIQRELELLKAADEGLRRTRLRRVCTMKTGLALMADGKYPKLADLYRYLTGKEHQDAHDALSDAKATAECFWGLVDRRMVEL